MESNNEHNISNGDQDKTARRDEHGRVPDVDHGEESDQEERSGSYNEETEEEEPLGSYSEESEEEPLGSYGEELEEEKPLGSYTEELEEEESARIPFEVMKTYQGKERNNFCVTLWDFAGQV